MRKELGRHEINCMCAKYPYECHYKGSHKATPEELTVMLNESKNRSQSYT